MIVSWISHDNRKQRRTKRSRARRAGRDQAIYRVTTEEIGQHIVALTVYLSSPSKARLDELVALERARQHVIHYIGSQKGEDEDVSEAEIDTAREMATRERVRQILTRNLLSTELEDVQFEMAVVTGLSPGGEDPIEHIVLSWPEGEHPSETQVEEALDILLTAAGMSRHQAYAVLHTDTPNDHLHVALNRIDPVSGQRVQIGLNLERSIETLHQTVSNIEYRQGWKPQANALYRADDTGVSDRATGARVRDAAMQPCASHADQKRIRLLRALEKLERKISPEARAYETRTGFESLQRRVIETAGPVFKHAESWIDVHRGLAVEGMRLRMLKDGAVIECGDRTIAASTEWGGASAAKMIERLGPFEKSPADLAIVAFQDRAIPNLRIVVEKRRERDALRQMQHGLASSIALASQMVGARYARQVADDPRSTTSDLNDARRETSVELNPFRTALQHLSQLQRERLRRERRALTRGESIQPDVDEDFEAPGAMIIGRDAGPAPLQHVASASDADEELDTVRHDDCVTYYRDARLIFVEHLDRIDLHATDDDAVRRALRIGAAKWGGPVVGIGDQRFLDRLARIAVEEGIELTNPELQGTMERLRRERVAEQQAAAVGATSEPSPVAPQTVTVSSDIPAILRDYAPQFADWIKLRADTKTPPAELQKCAVAIAMNAELARQLAELESQQFAFAKELRRSARRKRPLNALDFLGRDEFFHDGLSTSLDEVLPSFPGRQLTRDELIEEGVIFAPDSVDDVIPVIQVTVPEVADRPSPEQRQRASPQPSAPTDTGTSDAANSPSATAAATTAARPLPAASPSLTVLEEEHRAHVKWLNERGRARIDKASQAALAERVGANGAITPYAARLLGKIASGFDPDRVLARKTNSDLSLDERDAAEINTLSRLQSFRAQMATARAGDPVLLAHIESTSKFINTRINFLGLVGIEHNRIAFDTADKVSTGAWRTPLDHMTMVLPSILERQIPLTRHNGLVGIYDYKVLQLSKDNFVGLLHPSIQIALDVEERLQREQTRAIMAKLQTGKLTATTSIWKSPMSDHVSTSVRLLNGTPDEQRFVDLRTSDAGFYFQCREAVSATHPVLPSLRHDSAIVRAWLHARDENASVPVLTLLSARIKKEKAALSMDDMTASDARTLASLLNPPIRQIVPKPRRSGPRDRPANQRGRRNPRR